MGLLNLASFFQFCKAFHQQKQEELTSDFDWWLCDQFWENMTTMASTLTDVFGGESQVKGLLCQKALQTLQAFGKKKIYIYVVILFFFFLFRELKLKLFPRVQQEGVQWV